MTRSVGGRAPPGIERGPGGGLVENDISNGNTQLNSLLRPVLQSRRCLRPGCRSEPPSAGDGAFDFLRRQAALAGRRRRFAW
jgi:hypothetical protein